MKTKVSFADTTPFELKTYGDIFETILIFSCNDTKLCKTAQTYRSYRGKNLELDIFLILELPAIDPTHYGQQRIRMS